jgi:hypothetical protein
MGPPLRCSRTRVRCPNVVVTRQNLQLWGSYVPRLVKSCNCESICILRQSCASGLTHALRICAQLAERIRRVRSIRSPSPTTRSPRPTLPDRACSQLANHQPRLPSSYLWPPPTTTLCSWTKTNLNCEGPTRTRDHH